jgi:hypothetical protein
MITVIENRDFVEGVFSAKEKACEYYAKHPSQNTCRIIETGFTSYPFFVTETKRGSFRYFAGKKELIAFMKETNLDELPKAKVTYISITEQKTECVEKEDPSFTVYCIFGPYQSGNVNEDGMGGLWHDHLNAERFNWIIKSYSLKNMGMEPSLLQKLLMRLRSICRK